MAKVTIIILFTTFFRRICQSFGSPGIISGLALSATKDGETYADYYPFFQHQFDMLQYFLFGSRDTVTTQKDKITTPKGGFTTHCMKEFMWKSQSINPFRLALYMKVRTHLQRWLFAVFSSRVFCQHSEMLCNVAHNLCTPSRFIFNI